jgi:hemerythrin-like domain-containing protein
VAAENSKSLAERGHLDKSRLDGFIDYVRTFATVLDAHHVLEDELAFPYMRTKMPDVPYEVLMAQHQEMVPILNEIKATMEEMKANLGATESLNKLSRALARIAEVWYPHIRIEEDHFTADRIGAIMDMEEQVSLSRKFAEHSQQHAGPDYLVVPFLLYNLPPEDRSSLAQVFPPVVTQQLVPVAWKEKWASMKPFLLD